MRYLREAVSQTTHVNHELNPMLDFNIFYYECTNCCYHSFSIGHLKIHHLSYSLVKIIV